MENKTLFTKLYGYFPIAFVSVLLCWTFYVHLFRLSIPLIKQGSVAQGVAYIVLYHTFLFLFVLSYTRVTSKDAGSPKTSLEDPVHSSRNPFELDRNPWVEELESPNLSEKDEVHGLSALTVVRSNTSTLGDQAQRSDDPEAVKRALTGSEVRPAPPLLSPPPTAPGNIATLPKAKYCNTCNAMKPERCHHCSTCDKCVLKMDHHCPWINRCVGWGNYKLFYLFILYATLFCVFIIASVIPPLVSRVQRGNTVDIQWAILIAIAVLFGSCLLVLTGYHTKLIFKNETTIENLQHNRRNEGTEKRKNIYDLGWANNWKIVMGEDWWLWFVPYVNSIGNGHSFRTSENGRQGDGTTDMCRLNRNNAVLDSRYDMELPPIPRFEPLEPVSP